MKKDFQKFQNDFYEEVENTLVNFNEHTHTLQITEAPGIDGFPGMLEVLFGFVDVTGKDRLESQLIENTDDVTKAVAEFNEILKEDYPAFAQYKDLKDVITTAVEVKDPDNNYQVILEGDKDTALVYVTVHYDVLGNLLVTVHCPEDDYIETFTAKATPEEIESTVRLDVFGE